MGAQRIDGTYQCFDAKHGETAFVYLQTDMFAFYGISSANSDDELHAMFCAAYRGYYSVCEDPSEVQIARCIADFRKDGTLPTSVIRHYHYHTRKARAREAA